MRRRLARNLLIAASLAPLTSGAAFAQIFTRVAPESPMETASPACSDGGCESQWPYGYFHEHWRRWPEQHVPPTRPDMAPYVTPDRNVAPSTQRPDSRDEGSISPRNRTAQPKMSAPSVVTPPSDSVPSPSVAPDSSAAPRTEPSNSLFSEPAESGFDLPDADSDISPMPSDNQGSGGFDLPNTELPDSDLPFGDSSDSSAPLPPVESGSPAEDGGFNLDDFGRVDRQRMRRYRNPVIGQLRRATPHESQSAQSDERTRQAVPENTRQIVAADNRRASRSVRSAGATAPTKRPAAPSQMAAAMDAPGVRPVSYDAAPAGRANPLRGRISAGRSPVATPADTTPVETQPIAPASFETTDSIETFEVSQAGNVNLSDPVTVAGNRDNPLRR